MNLTGVFNKIAVAVPAMIDAGKGGSIVLMASGAALMNMPHLTDYDAAKAGVVSVAKTLADEVEAHQIGVNALAPGTARTPLVTENKGMFRILRRDLAQQTLEDALQVLKAMLHMGKKWVEPEDVAKAVRSWQRTRSLFTIRKRVICSAPAVGSNGGISVAG